MISDYFPPAKLGRGFMTDHVFGDPLAVGRSVALVNCVSVPIGAISLWFGLRHFRAAVPEQAAAG